MAESEEKSGRATAREWLVLACFFLSGGLGLVYEVCWIRRASLAFGATMLAASAVLAVFFAGLALGSYVFGRRSQNSPDPLKIYAWLEIGVGLTILANPLLFAAAESVYGTIYAASGHGFWQLFAVRFLLLLVLLLPPTFLMGGTFPLFCRRFVRNEKRITRSVGFLYGLNTLGAAAGCLACGFMLLPLLGMDLTFRLGSLANILIGLSVLALKPKANTPVVEAPEELPSPAAGAGSAMAAAPTETSGRVRRLLLALFFVTGFTALGNEILLTRYLSLLLHNTVFTYTITLAVTLLGIVAGSAIIGLLPEARSRLAMVFGAVQALLGISILVLLLLPPAYWRGLIDTTYLLSQLTIFLTVLLFPAILQGVSFPLGIRMAVHHPRMAGIGAGTMTAVNTCGGIFGALGFGLLVVPRLGMQRGLLLSTGLSLAVGIASWLFLEKRTRVVFRAVLVLAATAAWLLIPRLLRTRLPGDFLAATGELVDFREGLRSDLAVLKFKDNVVLQIDRLWQGQSQKNHQFMAAHIPMLLHQAPRDILVVGLGVGQTARRFLLYDIDRLDCVDIEETLPGLIRRHFDSAWMKDGRVRIIIEDGRDYITHSGSRYDLISIEIGQVFRPGLAGFYTLDFYRRLRAHLNRGGLAAQFLPVSSFQEEEFRGLIRTFLEVFPESILWYNTSELLLLGSADKTLVFNEKRLELVEEPGPIHDDLQYAYYGGRENWLNRREVFLAGFLCGRHTLQRLAGDSPVYRDDKPDLEYHTADYGSRWVARYEILQLLEKSLDPPREILERPLAPDALAAIESQRRKNLRKARLF